jgi:hypothetical protein
MSKPNMAWHSASKVASILQVADGFAGPVNVTDTPVEDARHPYIGVGVEGSKGRVYLALGTVGRYTPKDKATKKPNGPEELSWTYNGSTWLPLHGDAPTTALAEIAKVVAALQAITVEDITLARTRSLEAGTGTAPRAKGGRLADLLG